MMRAYSVIERVIDEQAVTLILDWTEELGKDEGFNMDISINGVRVNIYQKYTFQHRSTDHVHVGARPHTLDLIKQRTSGILAVAFVRYWQSRNHRALITVVKVVVAARPGLTRENLAWNMESAHCLRVLNVEGITNVHLDRNG